jgi:magnesium transporter
MIRSLRYTHDGLLSANLSLEDLASALGDADSLLWVDLSNEPADVCEPILRETFGFHPLAVDDALAELHTPKVDDWGVYIYLALHATAFDEEKDGLVDTLELDVFMGRNYLVTYRERPISAVDRLWETCRRDERYLRRGAAYLLYQLTDEVVADYMPVIEQLDEVIDRIEDQIFDDPAPELLERLFALKRALLQLRRVLAPQREVLNKLARGDFVVIEEGGRVFFRDVYDHLVRLHDIVESLRDLVGSALDTYLSVVSNRMNEVMKTLTIITTLFMPLSFVVGFFGMNFFQPVVSLGAWTGLPAFGLTLVGMILVPLAMFLWMRRRAWM